MAKENNNVDLSQYKRIHKEEPAKKEMTLPFSKKTLIIGIVVVLAACALGYALAQDPTSSYSTTVSDNKTLTSGDISVTKQDYFEYLLENTSGQTVLDMAYDKIADEVIKDGKDVDKKIKEEEDTYKTYYGTVKAYAEALGYKSVKDLEDKYLKAHVKKEMLLDKYIEDQFDSIMSTYTPSYVSVITVDKESEALKLIKKATDKSAFDKLVKDNNGTDTGFIYSETSSETVDENILKKLGDFYKLSKDSVYSEAIETVDGKYAVVFIYNTDKTKNKSTYVKDMNNISKLEEDCEAYYLKTYSFTVYDKKIKEEIKNINNNYIQ